MEELPTWDESARPPLVTYADAPPYAAGAQAHLRAIHDHYRHGLATVVGAAEEALAGRGDVADVRAAIHEAGLTQSYQRLSSYCSQLCVAVTQHHTIEDVVFQPQLRAADPAMDATLDRIRLEHEVVHGLLERIDRIARGLRGGAENSVAGRLPVQRGFGLDDPAGRRLGAAESHRHRGRHTPGKRSRPPAKPWPEAHAARASVLPAYERFPGT